MHPAARDEYYHGKFVNFKLPQLQFGAKFRVKLRSPHDSWAVPWRQDHRPPYPNLPIWPVVLPLTARWWGGLFSQKGLANVMGNLAAMPSVDWVAVQPMQSYKSQKIDHNASYPCPCRRQGGMRPIALTEAFGCDQCQQIFVVRDDDYVLEQLSTHYPYKRAWRWNGQQWRPDRAAFSASYLPMLVVVLFGVVVLVLLITLLQTPTGAQTVVRLLAALTISLLLVFMFWLASRR